MKRKVLVTGANGQLGKTIREAVVKVGVKDLEFVFTSKEELDITSKNKLDAFFNKASFDYCINCAAYTNVEQAEKNPEVAFKVNAEGVKNLAQICKEYQTVLVHISTDYVFDGEKRTPYEVTDKTNPINVYGESKLLGENYVQNVMNNYFIVRTSWLYSKRFGHNFYKTILHKVQSEKLLSITTDQTGRPTNTVNLARFIIKLIERKSNKYGVLHFSDGKAMTWYDFAKQILLENNLSEKINLVKVNNYRTFAKRPKYSVLKN